MTARVFATSMTADRDAAGTGETKFASGSPSSHVTSRSAIDTLKCNLADRGNDAIDEVGASVNS